MEGKKFVCEKCGAKFPKNQGLNKHKQRKTPCSLILELEDLPDDKKELPHKCKFCGRAYSRHDSLMRHMKKSCKIVPRNGDTSGMEKLYEHVERKQEEKHARKMREIEEMMEARIQRLLIELKPGEGGAETKDVVIADGSQMISHMAGPLASLAGTSNKNALVNVNKGMIDQSTKTININVFGSENTSHITHADILKILQGVGPLGADLRPAAEKVILQTAMLIHSDEKHPENITCYIPNQKGKSIMIHGKNGWEMIPGSLALSPMAHKGVDVLFEKQPYAGENGAPEDIADITRLMKYVKDNEGSLVGDAAKPGSEFRIIGIRNKSILEGLLPKLPAVGDK